MRSGMGWIVVCVVVCLGGWATAAEPELSPVLSKDVVGLVHWSGGDAWEAYQKTASYRAFYETGLVPALTKHVQQMPWQLYLTILQSDTGTKLQQGDVEAILNTLWQHGVTAAVGLQERDTPAPYVLLVVRGQADRFGELQQFVKTHAGEASLEVDVAGRKVLRLAEAEFEFEADCWSEGADLLLFATWGDASRRAVVDRLLTAPPEDRLVQQPQWTEAWAGEPVPTRAIRCAADPATPPMRTGLRELHLLIHRFGQISIQHFAGDRQGELAARLGGVLKNDGVENLILGAVAGVGVS